MAALAAAGLMLVGAREAAADQLHVAKGGIIQVGGGGSGTDPAYTDQFDVTLNGTIKGLLSGGPPTSITFDNVIGVYPLDLANSAPSGWVYSSVATGLSNSQFGPVFTSNVTWTYYGLFNINSTGSTPLDLGVFSVTTESNLPGGYPAALTQGVNYAYSIDGASSVSGGSSGALQVGGIGALSVQSVPEPSTAIAPLMVLLGVPVVMLVKRRALRASRRAA